MNKEELKEYHRKYYLENKEKINSKNQEWYCNNKEKRAKSIHAYYIENKEKKKLYCKDWYKKNKVRVLKNCSDYRKNNPEKVRFYSATYKARKIKATPTWVDLLKIKEFYESCPTGYEIDHIVPLQGKTVCGLHVPWNLQYLLPSENRSKGNKLLNGIELFTIS